MPPEPAATRKCADCGASLRYEGGVSAYGLLFCDDDCADAYEDEGNRITYAEDPLGGSWS